MIFDSIGQALRYLAECYKMVVEEPKLLLPSLISVVIGFFVGVIVIVASVLFGLFSHSMLSFMFGAFFLVALFISYAISYLFMSATSFAVYEHLKYGHSSLGKAYNATLAHAPTILALAFVAAVIGVLAGMLKNSRSNRNGIIYGLLATIFADVLEEGWKIASMLLIPIAVIGGLGFVDTFKKAFDIAKNNLVLIGAGEVGIRILTGVFGFIGVVLSLLIAFGLFAVLSPLSAVLGIAVAVIFAFTAISIVSTLNQFLRISFYTMVYVWAESGVEHGQPAAAVPAPLQHVFGA